MACQSVFAELSIEDSSTAANPEPINHLNGIRIPSFPAPQCDIDRSGTCAPADILRLIDLLNGVNTFRPWLGVTLPPRP